eukprot:evm.model.scf_854.3 EVM.evm.TU.scf_854.3   scf_854:11394-13779(+)
MGRVTPLLTQLGQDFRISKREKTCHRSTLSPYQICRRGVKTHIQASKGFGDERDVEAVQGPKLNKRGAVASRPGTPSKKTIKQMQMERREQELASAVEEEPSKAPQQEVPSVVSNRILKRILLFTGLPVFFGFLLLPIFYYLKAVKDVDIPNSVVFLTQILTLAAGLLGITYGVVSASWSAERKGSFLGIEEFKANLPLLMDMLKRK